MSDMTDISHSNASFDMDRVEDGISATYPPAPILLVDDEPDLLASYELALNSHGISNVIAVSDTDQVEDILQTRRVELLVVDLMMPPPTGEEILRWVRDHFPQLPVIVVPGNNDAETAVRCMQLGAAGYLAKRADRTRYISSIRKVIEADCPQRKSLNHIRPEAKTVSDVT